MHGITRNVSRVGVVFSRTITPQSRALVTEERVLRSRTEEAEAQLSSLELLRLEADRRTTYFGAQCNELQTRVAEVDTRNRSAIAAVQHSFEAVERPLAETASNLAELRAQHLGFGARQEFLDAAVDSLSAQLNELVRVFMCSN